jgi:hypothetical protein
VVEVAEQVHVGRALDEVVWMFDEHAEDRLRPLLGIAWLEGLGTLRRAPSLFEPHLLPRRHTLSLTDRTADSEAARAYRLRWTVLGRPLLFSSLVGALGVEPVEGGCVLGLRGVARLAPGGDHAPGIARRPVETAARALLGHLRNAVEVPSAPGR